MAFSQTALAMRSKYAPAERFLDALVHLYDEFERRGGDGLHPVQLRCCNLLSAWLSQAFASDFKGSKRMLLTLKLWLDSCRSKGAVLDSLCAKMSACLESASAPSPQLSDASHTNHSDVLNAFRHPLNTPDDIRLKSRTWCEAFLQLNTSVIADQLTCLESDIFCSIKTEDLLLHVNIAKRKNAVGGDTTSVDTSIGHFNFISAWVVTRVLMGKKPSARAKMLEKFIDVALNLRRRNNFNTLQSLISGLTSTPLSRLKQTQALLNPESAASFANLEILMSSERTFARYRHALAIADFPCIPYLGVVFRDLIYIEEGNKDLLPDGNVNFGKLLTMGDIILTVQGFQAKPHSVPKDPGVLSFILDSTVLSNEQSYDLSLQLEPRQSQKAPVSASS